MRKSRKQQMNYFDLLLGEVAQEVWEEEMSQIPSGEELDKMYTFSEEFQRKMRRMIETAQRREHRRTSIRRGLAVAACLALLWMALNPGVVAKAAKELGDALKEWLETYAVFDFEKSEEELPEHIVGYVPDGFTLTYEVSTENYFKACYEKVGEKESLQIICIRKKVSWVTDNDEKVYEIILKDNPTTYYCLEEEGITEIFWKDEEECFYQVSGPLRIEELFEIIEKIEK